MIKVLLTILPMAILLFAADDKKPAASELKGDLQRGRAIFDNVCAECHDSNSKDEGIGPGLKGIKEGKLPDGNKATREKLLDIINRGPAEMPSFRDKFTEQEKADVVDFVLTL